MPNLSRFLRLQWICQHAVPLPVSLQAVGGRAEVLVIGMWLKGLGPLQDQAQTPPA